MIRILCLSILLSCCGGPQIVPTVGEEDFSHPFYPCEVHEDGVICSTCTCDVCKAPPHPDYYEEAKIVEAPLGCSGKDIDGDGEITWNDCYLWDKCRRSPQNCVGIEDKDSD